MNLKQKIAEDTLNALKSKDELVLSTLRMVLAAAKNLEIEKQRELTEEEFISVIQRQVKTHKESIAAFQAGKRDDLVAKESKELLILGKYLPEQIPAEELRLVVEGTVKELQATPNDFGKVMKEVMLRVKGKADGGQVSQLVKELLASIE